LEPDPEEATLLVRMLRALHGGALPELAASAGLAPSSIWRYEHGKMTPPRATLERLAAAAGVPAPLLDAVLLPAVRAVRAGRPSVEQRPDDSRAASALTAALDGLVRASLVEFEAELESLDGAAAEEEGLRERDLPPASELWRRMADCTGAERRLLVEKSREFQTWGLCETLCDESERAAARHPAEARELAELALRVAELAPGDEPRRCRYLGYARGFLANAHRVADELRQAEEEFARAWTLWRAGSAAKDVLPEWRLLDREASLRRALRQWHAALELLDRARSSAPLEAVGRILLNRAATLDQAGETNEALATLQEAAPLVEAGGSPRLRWALQFNLTGSLCLLERYAEAEALLPQVQAAADRLGNALDLVRARWLTGRVAAGRGRKEEARAAFEQVRSEFAARRMGYDAALVSLELAVLYLEEGRTAEVRGLAAEMAWIFEAQGVHREALAALALFRRAAGAERASVEQARRLLSYLGRARQDRDLRFEA
jgi:transcriptional regulator with XRE-family HTH domain